MQPRARTSSNGTPVPELCHVLNYLVNLTWCKFRPSAASTAHLRHSSPLITISLWLTSVWDGFQRSTLVPENDFSFTVSKHLLQKCPGSQVNGEHLYSKSLRGPGQRTVWVEEFKTSLGSTCEQGSQQGESPELGLPPRGSGGQLKVRYRGRLHLPLFWRSRAMAGPSIQFHYTLWAILRNKN